MGDGQVRSAGVRPPIVEIAGALVIAGGVASLLVDTIGRTRLSWTWVDAGISALVGTALFAVAADDDRARHIYCGTCTSLGEVQGATVWAARAVVLLLAPVAGIGVGLYALASLFEAVRHPLRPPLPMDWRKPVGTGLLGLAWILAVRAAGARVGSDAEIYSVLLIGAGLPLFWGAAGARAVQITDRAVLDHGARTALGLVLTVAGATLVLSTTGLFHQAQRTIVGTAIALGVLGLVVGPRWRRTSRRLFEQRATLERAQDRADMADHLHDSVLQTLALIQRRSDDPAEVSSLARRQERELREWLLADSGVSGPSGVLSRSLRAAAAEIEDAERTRIEVVTVGDAPLTEPVRALVAAAREAMSNAVRHGESPVSVFCRVAEREVNVYVHDRGRGFDVDQVPPDRRGVRESIIARTARHGGTAEVRVTPGAGCEIALTMPR